LTGVGFRRGEALAPRSHNRNNKVGRDRGKCRFSPRKEKVKCPCRHSPERRDRRRRQHPTALLV